MLLTSYTSGIVKHKHTDQYGITEYSTWYKVLLGFTFLYLYIALAADLLVIAEQDIGNINTYANAFWTLQMAASTIGFGDFYPVTFPGRVIVSLSFYVGVGLAGYIGSTIASALTSHTDQSVMNRELRQQNERILDTLKRRPTHNRGTSGTIGGKTLKSRRSNEKTTEYSSDRTDYADRL